MTQINVLICSLEGHEHLHDVGAAWDPRKLCCLAPYVSVCVMVSFSHIVTKRSLQRFPNPQVDQHLLNRLCLNSAWKPLKLPRYHRRTSWELRDLSGPSPAAAKEHQNWSLPLLRGSKIRPFFRCGLSQCKANPPVKSNLSAIIAISHSPKFTI